MIYIACCSHPTALSEKNPLQRCDTVFNEWVPGVGSVVRIQIPHEGVHVVRLVAVAAEVVAAVVSSRLVSVIAVVVGLAAVQERLVAVVVAELVVAADDVAAVLVTAICGESRLVVVVVVVVDSLISMASHILTAI